MSSDPKLIPYVLPLIQGCRILDVGCGKGKWGYLIRVDFWYTAGGRRGEQLASLVGVDRFLPYLKSIRDHRIYDEVILCEVTQLPLSDRSFHTTLVIEVLEHLRKQDGYSLLREAERLSSKQVIVTTPGYRTSITSRVFHDDNPLQRHASMWTPDEFEKLGYHIIRRPIFMERCINYASYLFPRLTGLLPQPPVSIIAVKNI